jgi:hypothetical protein
MKVYVGDDGYYMAGHPGHTAFVPNDGRWKFNGNLERPTFTPSVNENPDLPEGHHFIITDGVIHYLKDRTAPCCVAEPAELWTIPDWDAIG